MIQRRIEDFDSIRLVPQNDRSRGIEADDVALNHAAALRSPAGGEEAGDFMGR
jgi:hypothetical protein